MIALVGIGSMVSRHDVKERLIMSRKLLLVCSIGVILVVNTVLLGSLYLGGVIFQPTAAELEAQRIADEKAKKAMADAIKYAHLEPLPEFKSKANYVASMGEAVDICERKLHDFERSIKSWAVNYIESRYLPEKELYLIFIDYQTIPLTGEEPKVMKATCDVDEAKKEVAAWKADPMEA